MDLPLREPNINIMAELLYSHSQQHSTPNYCSFLCQVYTEQKTAWVHSPSGRSPDRRQLTMPRKSHRPTHSTVTTPPELPPSHLQQLQYTWRHYTTHTPVTLATVHPTRRLTSSVQLLGFSC
jgi:hypothetical protein